MDLVVISKEALAYLNLLYKQNESLLISTQTSLSSSKFYFDDFEMIREALESVISDTNLTLNKIQHIFTNFIGFVNTYG